MVFSLPFLVTARFLPVSIHTYVLRKDSDYRKPHSVADTKSLFFFSYWGVFFFYVSLHDLLWSTYLILFFCTSILNQLQSPISWICVILLWLTITFEYFQEIRKHLTLARPAFSPPVRLFYTTSCLFYFHLAHFLDRRLFISRHQFSANGESHISCSFKLYSTFLIAVLPASLSSII